MPYERPWTICFSASLRPKRSSLPVAFRSGIDQPLFAGLLTTLKSYGVPLWIDTSGPALLTAIAAQPAAVKPNETELADWAGSALDSNQQRQIAAERLHASGIEHALISAGSEGVLWASSQGTWQSTPPSVNATNTVCAGDTFVAGMLHGLLSNFAPQDTLRFATALSAEAVRHVGVGTPHADDFSSTPTTDFGTAS